ncbi:MAG TPA: TonB family protein [Burkholderiales bacterium]
MDSPASPSALPKNDRLGVTLFGSLLLHMVVILGVTFAAPKLRDLHALPTLEITLVQTATPQAPEKPDYLAQANQDGGGESERPDTARNPLPLQDIDDAPKRVPAMRPQPQRPAPPKREVRELMTQRQAEQKAATPQPEPPQKQARIDPAELGLPSPDLVTERARLNAEISRVWEEYQKRPRRKFVNARTQEYKYAAYMDAWRAKVERIGNLNYPEEAKRRGLRGNVILDVAVNADGSVRSVSILRSSGQKLIDDAAIRIVHLAAPFAPFPPAIRAETDILHITRTWKFNDTLTSEH